MANPFFFGSPRGAGFEFLSDVAAAERQVDAYFAQLHSQPTVPPEGAAAFALTSEQAVEAYTRWLNSLSFVPGGLKRFADLGALKAVYVPFWVVNAMTHTTYQGQRGVNHLETEHYQDAQGNAQTRQITRTQWSPAIGEVTHYFENVLISGKDALPPAHVTLLTPPDLIQKMEVYAPDRHTHPVEPYTVDPRAAFTRARTEMEAEIRKLCRRQHRRRPTAGGKQPDALRRRVGAPRSGSLLPGDLQIPGQELRRPYQRFQRRGDGRPSGERGQDRPARPGRRGGRGDHRGAVLVLRDRPCHEIAGVAAGEGPTGRGIRPVGGRKSIQRR